MSHREIIVEACKVMLYQTTLSGMLAIRCLILPNRLSPADCVLAAQRTPQRMGPVMFTVLGAILLLAGCVSPPPPPPNANYGPYPKDYNEIVLNYLRENPQALNFLHQNSSGLFPANLLEEIVISPTPMPRYFYTKNGPWCGWGVDLWSKKNISGAYHVGVDVLFEGQKPVGYFAREWVNHGHDHGACHGIWPKPVLWAVHYPSTSHFDYEAYDRKRGQATPQAP